MVLLHVGRSELSVLSMTPVALTVTLSSKPIITNWISVFKIFMSAEKSRAGMETVLCHDQRKWSLFTLVLSAMTPAAHTDMTLFQMTLLLNVTLL